MKDDRFYLQHIKQPIEQIDAYRSTRDDFMQNPMMQDAIIRQLEIIGEATKMISSETRTKYPSLPWREMAGMRDKLIHAYFGVDLAAVWDTADSDLPPLARQIQEIINCMTDN